MLFGRGVAEGAGTHDGGHVAALVGRRHQGAQVGLAAHAGAAGRWALVLHALGQGAWRQQAGGGAVAAEAAVSCKEEEEGSLGNTAYLAQALTRTS